MLRDQAIARIGYTIALHYLLIDGVNDMSLGSLLGKLFGGAGAGGGGGEKIEDAIDYQGYSIRPAPKTQGGQFIIAGVISKTFADGELKEHTFIRADTHASRDDACAHAIRKAQQIIDEQGDRLFGNN